MLKKVRQETHIFPKELNYQEIEEAEKRCILAAQMHSFSEEIYCLKEKNKTLQKSSKLSELCPFLDSDDILRISGRLNFANYLDESTRNPIILDPKSQYTKLILKEYHEKNGHQGVETVLNDIRKRFWILKGRSAVKNTFKMCQFCKIKKSKPEIPKMGQAEWTSRS